MVLSWLKKWFHDTVMKSDARLMSTRPSCALDSVLWAIQIRVEPCCTSIASSDEPRKLRFWMITLVTPDMSSPPPVMPEPEPTPMTVLLEATCCMPLTETMPLTRTTAGELDWMALIHADEVVTVTGVALPPPVVPAPNPVGLPTAAACVADHTVNAAAAPIVRAPASARRAID